MNREINITKKARIQAKALGFTEDIEKKLKRLVKFSAPYTHEYGNRRFKTYVLWIEKDELKQIVEINKIQEDKRLCPDCRNDGLFCLTCNSTGYI